MGIPSEKKYLDEGRVPKKSRLSLGLKGPKKSKQWKISDTLSNNSTESISAAKFEKSDDEGKMDGDSRKNSPSSSSDTPSNEEKPEEACCPTPTPTGHDKGSDLNIDTSFDGGVKRGLEDSPNSTQVKRSRRLVKTLKMEPLRPCVATFENQGNTCFVNAALQVLRYTPSLVPRLHSLASIIYKAKQCLQNSELRSSLQGWKIPREWEIVEELDDTFAQMERSEAQYAATGANPDVLVIHPEILPIISELNAIFEGNQQQDAHEFLQCVLVYIEEAWIKLKRLDELLPDLHLLTEPCKNSQVGGGLTNGCRKQASYKPLVKYRPNRIANGCVSPAASDSSIGSDGMAVTSRAALDRCASDGLAACVSLSRCDPLLSDNGTLHISNPDVIGHLFKGDMAMCTRCLVCESERSHNQEFQEIQVSVKDDRVDDQPSDCDENTENWPINELQKKEKLGGIDKCYCDECLTRQEVQRFVRYRRMPRRLILHVKRFAAERIGNNAFFSRKINTYARTPINLPCVLDDCEPHCKRRAHTYQLYAIMCHHGATINAGHYLSYVRVTDSANLQSSSQCGADVPKQDDWLECDDDWARILSHEDLCSTVLEPDSPYCANTPYLLCYTRSDQV